MKQYPHTLGACVLSALLFVLVGCSKQETMEAPQFDPKYIAAEADKGNLGPLTDLNNACTAEVQKNGKRAASCAVQAEVRRSACYRTAIGQADTALNAPAVSAALRATPLFGS